MTGSVAALGLAGCLSDDDGDGNGDDESDHDHDHTDDGHDHDHNGSDGGGHNHDHNGGDGDDHNESDDDDHDLPVEEFEILDRNRDEAVLASLHGDHWHGDPLEVPHDDDRSLGAHVTDEDGDEVALGDDIELDAVVADGANDIVDVDARGDRVVVRGTEEGFTDLAFKLVDDDDVVYETPELESNVVDDR